MTIHYPIEHRPSRFAKWSLVAGIVIVVNMFFNYAISLVYKEPEYRVSQSQLVEQYRSASDCVRIGGQWTEAPIAPAPDGSQPKSAGYCDPDYTRRQHYEASHKVYQRNVFIVLVILGITTLIVGVLVTQDVLAAAFSWGGVLSLLIASMRYWSAAENLVKVLILAAALAGLIWVAVRKFNK